MKEREQIFNFEVVNKTYTSFDKTKPNDGKMLHVHACKALFVFFLSL